jgi:hypothetical protein
MRCSWQINSGVSGSPRSSPMCRMAAKLLAIMRSERSRGSRPERIMSFATSRVVAAPSSWLDRIDSSMSELTRYLSRVAGLVTCSVRVIWPETVEATNSISRSTWSGSV